MKKLNDFIDKILKTIVIGCLGSMLLIIFVQVVSRYAFHYSLSFSEELARYLFVWTVFLCIPVVQRMGGHMTLGVITERISGKPLKTLRIVADILTIIFMTIILKNGIVMVQKTSFQVSPAMQICMSYIYLAIPIGSAAMLLNLVENLIDVIKTPSSETKPEFSEA